MLLSFLLEVLRLEHTIPRMLLAALSSVASYKDALQILVSALVRACLILCTAIASIMCWGSHCTAGPPMEKISRPSFQGRLGPGMWPLAKSKSRFKFTHRSKSKSKPRYKSNLKSRSEILNPNVWSDESWAQLDWGLSRV